MKERGSNPGAICPGVRPEYAEVEKLLVAGVRWRCLSGRRVVVVVRTLVG